MLRTLSTSYFADSTAKYVCEIPMGDRYHCRICSTKFEGARARNIIYLCIYIYMYTYFTNRQQKFASWNLSFEKKHPNQKIYQDILHDLNLEGIIHQSFMVHPSFFLVVMNTWVPRLPYRETCLFRWKLPPGGLEVLSSQIRSKLSCVVVEQYLLWATGR